MKIFFSVFSIASFFSWLIWLPLYGPALGIEGLPVFPYHHAFGALGPMLAAFIISYKQKGVRGLNVLLFRMVDARNKPFLLMSVFSPFVLLALASAIDFFINDMPIEFSDLGKTKEFPEFSFFAYFFYNFLFFGLGEEVGWAGIAMPQLQRRWNALLATTLFTIFWATWHWPLFFYRPGFTSMNAAGVAGWLFSLLTGRVLLSWLLNSSSGSILICALFHATIDVAFVSEFTTPNRTNYLGMLITIWGVITVLVFGYRHLSQQQRFTQELNDH